MTDADVSTEKQAILSLLIGLGFTSVAVNLQDGSITVACWTNPDEVEAFLHVSADAVQIDAPNTARTWEAIGLMGQIVRGQ